MSRRTIPRENPLSCPGPVTLVVMLVLSFLGQSASAQSGQALSEQATSGVLSSPTAERSRPLKGIVWSEPSDLQHAVRELTYFADSGVEAVRTGIIRDTSLFAVGDSIGIQFFQELPYSFLPSGVLNDSLEAALGILDRALLGSASHRSARHFGLARSSDTSSRSACGFFQTLSSRVRQRIPDARTYYVSHFVEGDACGLSVDFVLLDRFSTNQLLTEPNNSRLAEGRARAYGIGELGRRVDARAFVGLNQPHSAESQARYLEASLPRLLESEESALTLEAVFVERWGPSENAGLYSPYAFSLAAESGEYRPAWDVVRGIYSGQQWVFAFPAGPERDDEMPWLALFGLLIFSVLAISYAASPQFRQLVPRYFVSHGFYREAAAQGRDVTPVVNGVLLAAVSLSIGVTGSILFYSTQHLHAVQTFLFWLPDGIAQTMLALGQRPWLLAILIACIAALSTIVWISMMSVGSRTGRTLVPAQTLMLALWPQWLVLVLLPVALVLPSFSPSVLSRLVPILFVAAVGVSLWILVRVILDFRAASRGPAWVSILVGFGNPIVLLIGLGALFMLPRLQYVAFLIKLLSTT